MSRSSLPSSTSQISHIVAFPYNLNLELGLDGQPQPKLSVLSSMVVDATVVLWEAEPEAHIVIPGATCYPVGLPSTTDLMAERIYKAGIPEEAVVGLHCLADGSELNNTHLQAEALREYFDGHPMGQGKHALTVTLGYHQRRARQACEVRDINTQHTTAEAVLAAVGKMEGYERFMPYFQALKRSEWLLNALNHIDPTGERVANWVTQYLGARVVDFDEKPYVDNAGDARTQIVVENLTAARKFKQVTGYKPTEYIPLAAPGI